MLIVALIVPADAVSQSPASVNLGSTTNFAVLSDSTVSNNPTSAVTRPAAVIDVEIRLPPQEFALFQNDPNPFNPSTRIQYSLEKAVQVSLKVYNLIGIEVAVLVRGRQEAGSHTVTFNTNKGTFSLASGVYFYRLEAGSFVSTKKMVVVK